MKMKPHRRFQPLAIIAAGLVAAMGLTAPTPTRAATMTILNNSFESPDADNILGYTNPAVIPSWTAKGGYYNGAGVADETLGLTPDTAAGVQWLFLVVDAPGEDDPSAPPTNDPTNQYVWQKVGTVADATYTLNYVVGVRSINAGYVPGTVANDAGLFNISLWAGGTAPFAADGATLLGEDSTIDIPETFPETEAQLAQSSTFVASTNLGQDLWLRLHLKDDGTSVGNPGESNQILFDNITGEFVPIPEPASLALLAAGGLMMIRRRRA